MAKSRSSFVCQACGAVTSRWQGRCDACGDWNTIVEELTDSGVGAGPKSAKAGGRATNLVPLSGETESAARVVTGMAEFDRVTGGGFVKGSALLVGGDPGIGKSTLLLQSAAALANRGKRVIYVSGEEAVAQVRLRAQRLGLGEANVMLAAETNVEIILATLENGPVPDLVIIDSIQTLWTDRVDSSPGTVTQVRTSAQALTRFAKKSGAAVVLVGHVTKDGQIAGPRVVEHMVDAVLYFEGDASHTFRILRAVKNRYGATDEIGVFAMTELGLEQVLNPSALFLDQRDDDATGSAVFAGMEGTRPLLIEIQALVAPSPLGTPRRAVVGWDSSRLSMVLAVLETRCGVRIGANDIYLNVAGGLKINEPAADLAVAAALISSLTGSPLPKDSVYFGEISLAGGIRPVAHGSIRLREAQKLGFKSVCTGRLGTADKSTGLEVSEFTALADLVGRIAANGKPREAPRDEW
ncbi:DNA repair protein RadA [Devosia psychrophila]|uniref:DNA repair protein RadA n=1 Tax=Devosia psychrophila TaxID=728005 RepID=A0A0F5Q1Z9_9HYPH|nr:DNA repair protein RadA [Devosia psychrophila]KKC34646.1 DNA repair protein RadA [Devosia psychrophila]SFD01596.1 DNA repair protein RadA/Sms [Devosia psychrophila]